MKKNSIFLATLLLNSIGSNFYVIALPLLVYNYTESAANMGTMGVVETVPIVLFGPIIGAVVDRLDLKKLLSFNALLQAFLFLGIYEIYEKSLSIIFLYILGGLISINVQFFKVAMFTLVPAMFKNLEMGNAKISSINAISELIAPFMASAIIYQVGVSRIFVINAFISFVFFIVTIATLEIAGKAKMNTREPTNLFLDTMKGFKLIINNRSLLLLIVIISISNLSDAGLIQLLMYNMANDYSIAQSTISLVIGVSGIGAFIATFVPRFIKGVSIGRRLFWGLMFNNFGIFLLLIPTWKIIPITLLICNFGGMIYNIAQNTLIQKMTDREMLGKINGTVRLLVQVTKPVSLSILMFMANSYGSYYGILTSVGLTFLTTIMLVISKLGKLEF